ncbi:MAG TPA: hypothetical protein VL947_08550, partial [Cytophagales bacterium]|nr:hypothetical protein [Cytophagales bacterium]
LLGRADFVINSGGIKIHPEQIEDQIGQHLSLDCSYVISSVPDEKLGEAMVLVIEGTQIPNIDFQFLDKYHRPKAIKVIKKFPLTNSGKIDRMQIKKIIFTP